jgi:hypothetical protein
MKIPPWPLRREPLPESKRLRQLRVGAEATAAPPAAVWREAYFLLLARLEQSKDPRIRRLGDISFDEAHSLTYRRLLARDQSSLYDEILDGMRRLNISRVRPGARNLWDVFLRCQQVRRQLEKQAVDATTAKRRAIAQIADEYSMTPRVLHAQFSKWGLDPGSDDMVSVPNRDPRPAPFVDFDEVPKSPRRRGRR